jgi:hypothetical protein
MNGGGINQWEIAPDTMQTFLKVSPVGRQTESLSV